MSDTLFESSSAPVYLGLDLGGTKVLALVATADGRVLGEAVLPTPAAEGPEAVVQTMANAAGQAVEAARIGPSAIRSAGVAVAGAVNQKLGVVVHSPHLAGWDQVSLAPMLEAHLRVPVVIDNDANMAALGEHRYGTGRGVQSLLFVTVGTGIGGGIIIGGRLYHGNHGYAGEIGHISVLAGGPHGKSPVSGALEALAGGAGLVDEVARRLRNGEASSLQRQFTAGGAEALTGESVFEAYHQGDDLAKRVVAQGAAYLGAGLVSLVNVLDPEMLIVGGGLAGQWEAYIQPAVDIVRSQAMAGMGRDLPVVPADLGVAAGALGGVGLAVDAAGPALDT